MIKPYYSEPNITIYNGDCLEVINDIDNNVVLITDPPYGINLDLKWLTKMQKDKNKALNKSDDKIFGDDKPFDLAPFLKFNKRLIFGFPYIYDEYATGWIVWDKQPKIEERYFMTPVEMASTTLRKGFDIIRVMWSGFLRDSETIETRTEHPTQKPIKLFYRLIEKYTKDNDIIFDPFLGSGTTARACKDLGRKCIGIEISKKYCDIAIKRLAQEVFNFE